MDKKEARIILKVTKDSSRNEIERKYGIYLKRHKIEQLKATQTPETGEDQDEMILRSSAAETEKTRQPDVYSFEQITKAYDILMGYEIPQKPEVPGKAAPLFKKAGIDEKKAKNFFHYYKFHILAIVVVIIFIVFTVRGCVNRVDPDFNLAFVGRIFYSNTEEDLKNSIRANVPQIAEPGIDGAYLSDESMGEQEYAMQMKATLLIAAGDIDVFILDKATFESYAKQGALMSLDEIAPRLGVDLQASQEFIVTVDDDTVQESDRTHLFGIDISNSAVLKEIGVLGEEKIAAIYVRCDQIEKAEKLIQFFMKE